MAKLDDLFDDFESANPAHRPSRFSFIIHEWRALNEKAQEFFLQEFREHDTEGVVRQLMDELLEEFSALDLEYEIKKQKFGIDIDVTCKGLAKPSLAEALKAKEEEMAKIGDLLKGIKNADPRAGGGGRKIKVDGEHLVEIEKCAMRDSQRFAGTLFIVEFKVISSTADGVEGKYSWVHDVTNKFFGLPRLKQFMCAALGITDLDSEEAGVIGEDHVLEAIADDQPLAGIQVNLQTIPSVAENSGRPFVKYEWSAAT